MSPLWVGALVPAPAAGPGCTALTWTSVLCKALAVAVQEQPRFNAAFDAACAPGSPRCPARRALLRSSADNRFPSVFALKSRLAPMLLARLRSEQSRHPGMPFSGQTRPERAAYRDCPVPAKLTTRPIVQARIYGSLRVQYRSYCDFYLNSGYRSFPQEHRRQNGRWSFQMVQVTQDAHDFSDPPVEETVVAMAVKSGARTWAWNMGDGWRSEDGAAGRILVLPPETASDWHVDGPRDVVLCVVPNTTFRGVLGSSCPGRLRDIISSMSDSTLSDPVLESLLTHLWQAASGSSVYERRHCEGLLTALLFRLLTLSSHACKDDSRKLATLSPQVMVRIEDFADSNIEGQVHVADLADLANLSLRHFSRAFHNTVGDTPHRWLLARRIDRAKTLLLESDLNLLDIALSCGFSSQAHFTTMFRHQVGTTPHRWRREQVRL